MPAERKESSLKQTEVKKNSKWKGFWIYFGLILISLASLYPVVYNTAVATTTEGLEGYESWQIAGLSLLQPLTVITGALLIGHFNAEKVRLRSVIYEQSSLHIRSILSTVLIGGAVVGLVTGSFDIVFRPWLPDAFQGALIVPGWEQILSSILYGGITQEILLRFGLMTIIVYVFSLGGQKLNRYVYLFSILFSAIIFTVGNISVFEMSTVLWVRLFVMNGLGSIIFGWIYYKHHLEAAILAHMFSQIVFLLMRLCLILIGL